VQEVKYKVTLDAKTRSFVSTLLEVDVALVKRAGVWMPRTSKQYNVVSQESHLEQRHLYCTRPP
jgi:hypothetical protein